MKSLEAMTEALKTYSGRPLRFMEVCGTHTHNIVKNGIHEILPPSLSLISGPGCPVCVTPAEYIDKAAELSLTPGTVLCSYGDMIRVPGRNTSLHKAKAAGGEVRMIYSPLSVLEWAAKEPDKLFVVTAVGFETTLPLYALLLRDMEERGILNIRLLTSLKVLLPALHWICENDPLIDGFLGPGHVSAILGRCAYDELCSNYQIPLAVGGFRYELIIAALYDLMRQCQKGTCEAHNLYPNAVSESGNEKAQALIDTYFTKKTSLWRGLGAIPGSGYFLADAYSPFDAGDWEREAKTQDDTGCLCGSVIIGKANPTDCPFFGTACTPLDPIGPCMVSAEGACGIWHRGGRKSLSGGERL